ncbi:unnamed protein product, partial [Prunus brigantina]
ADTLTWKQIQNLFISLFIVMKFWASWAKKLKKTFQSIWSPIICIKWRACI